MKKVIVFLVLGIFFYAPIASNTTSTSLNEVSEEKKTKLFVMFRFSGPAFDASTLKLSDKEYERKILTNEEIMNEVKKRCEGVEFIGNISPIRTDEEAIRKVDNLPEDIDGIVIFGPLSYGHAFGGPLTDKLIKTDLPIIVVFPFWAMWQEDFSYQGYKGKKILTAQISVVRDNSRAVESSRFEDLAKKIKLIEAISQLKGFRILSITDNPPLGRFTISYGEEYEKNYIDNLKKIFGVELVTIPQKELFNKIQEVLKSEYSKAEQIAEMWIEGAEEVMWDEVTKDDIIKSAATYLAMKKLRDQYNCNTVTTEGYHGFAYYEEGCIPFQGLASMQMSTEEPVAVPSETLLYSFIIQQLGLNMTGRPGINGDYLIDNFNNVAHIMHCEGPLNVYGDERRCPYNIRNMWFLFENQQGAVVEIKYPSDETVTVLGMGINEKKLSVFTGKTIDGRTILEDLNNMYCRSKLVIKTNAEALLENVNWEIFHQHRVAFYGDFREEFKNLAKLIGFEIVEVDR